MTALHHVGYWVDDLDQAMERASRTLGVGPFLVHPHIRFDSFTLADGTPVTDPAYFDHSAAFTAWGTSVLELGVVHTVDPWLETAYGLGGSGPVRPGHVSWVVEHLDAEVARLEAAGCALIHRASVGAVSVSWHDGGELFPHPIEVHRAGAPINGMLPRLTALAASWDGVELTRPMAPPVPA